jgi:hypothetical protein
LPIADLNLITGAASLVPKGHELLLERENHDRKDHGPLFQLEIGNRQSAML